MSSARNVLVHKTGRLFGTVKTDTAEIHGTVQGDVVVKNLIDIRSSGNVSGNVKYGRLALEMGGNLTAEMRNVPPSVGGDLNLEVAKGHSVPITLQDLTALDPDDAAKDLKFTVTKAKNGFVALSTRAEAGGQHVHAGRPRSRPRRVHARRHQRQRRGLRHRRRRPHRRHLRRRPHRDGCRAGLHEQTVSPVGRDEACILAHSTSCDCRSGLSSLAGCPEEPRAAVRARGTGVAALT